MIRAACPVAREKALELRVRNHHRRVVHERMRLHGVGLPQAAVEDESTACAVSLTSASRLTEPGVTPRCLSSRSARREAQAGRRRACRPSELRSTARSCGTVTRKCRAPFLSRRNRFFVLAPGKSGHEAARTPRPSSPADARSAWPRWRDWARKAARSIGLGSLQALLPSKGMRSRRPRRKSRRRGPRRARTSRTPAATPARSGSGRYCARLQLPVLHAGRRRARRSPAGRRSSSRNRTASTRPAGSAPSSCRRRSRWSRACRSTRTRRASRKASPPADLQGNSLHDSSPFLIDGFGCARTSQR